MNGPPTKEETARRRVQRDVDEGWRDCVSLCRDGAGDLEAWGDFNQYADDVERAGVVPSMTPAQLVLVLRELAYRREAHVEARATIDRAVRAQRDLERMARPSTVARAEPVPPPPLTDLTCHKCRRLVPAPHTGDGVRGTAPCPQCGADEVYI